jgi:hypothetical protein
MSEEEAMDCKSWSNYHFENFEIRVEILEVGYVIAVGCKRFAISNKETLINMLTKYFNNPEELQKQFHDKTLIIK